MPEEGYGVRAPCQDDMFYMSSPLGPVTAGSPSAPHRCVHNRSPTGPAALAFALSLLTAANLPASPADEAAPDPAAILPAPFLPPPAIPAPAFNPERILGVIPNYQTVNDPSAGVLPLTRRQKWNLAWKETVDPFNIANALAGAVFSQADNETPAYGRGGAAFARRFAAANADLATQNFFSAGLFAVVLHQDPRYFRMGPKANILKRVGYSISRLAVAQQDSGKAAFNASNFLGMSMGIAASNAYYPEPSRRGTVMFERLTTSLTGGVIGNLMSEFWPDIQKKLPHFLNKQK